MKTTRLIACLLCLFVTATTHAQQQHDPRDARRRGMAEHWIERLERQNPEQAAQLRQLQTDDPQAFVQAIRERVQQHRLNALYRKYPAFEQFINSMPEPERNQFLEDLNEPMGLRGRRPPPPPLQPPPHDARNGQDDLYNRASLSEADKIRLYEERIAQAERHLDMLKQLLEQRKAAQTPPQE